MQARVRLPEFSFPRGALVDTAAGEIPLNSLGPARKPLHAVGAARGSAVGGGAYQLMSQSVPQPRQQMRRPARRGGVRDSVGEDGGEILRSTQQAVRAFRKRSLGCAAPPLQRLVRVAQQQGVGGQGGHGAKGAPASDGTGTLVELRSMVADLEHAERAAHGALLRPGRLSLDEAAALRGASAVLTGFLHRSRGDLECCAAAAAQEQRHFDERHNALERARACYRVYHRTSHCAALERRVVHATRQGRPLAEADELEWAQDQARRQCVVEVDRTDGVSAEVQQAAVTALAHKHGGDDLMKVELALRQSQKLDPSTLARVATLVSRAANAFTRTGGGGAGTGSPEADAVDAKVKATRRLYVKVQASIHRAKNAVHLQRTARGFLARVRSHRLRMERLVALITSGGTERGKQQRSRLEAVRVVCGATEHLVELLETQALDEGCTRWRLRADAPLLVSSGVVHSIVLQVWQALALLSGRQRRDSLIAHGDGAAEEQRRSSVDNNAAQERLTCTGLRLLCFASGVCVRPGVVSHVSAAPELIEIASRVLVEGRIAQIAVTAMTLFPESGAICLFAMRLLVFLNLGLENAHFLPHSSSKVGGRIMSVFPVDTLRLIGLGLPQYEQITVFVDQLKRSQLHCASMPDNSQSQENACHALMCLHTVDEEADDVRVRANAEALQTLATLALSQLALCRAGLDQLSTHGGLAAVLRTVQRCPDWALHSRSALVLLNRVLDACNERQLEELSGQLLQKERGRLADIIFAACLKQPHDAMVQQMACRALHSATKLVSAEDFVTVKVLLVAASAVLHLAAPEAIDANENAVMIAFTAVEHISYFLSDVIRAEHHEEHHEFMLVYVANHDHPWRSHAASVELAADEKIDRSGRSEVLASLLASLRQHFRWSQVCRYGISLLVKFMYDGRCPRQAIRAFQSADMLCTVAAVLQLHTTEEDLHTGSVAILRHICSGVNCEDFVAVFAQSACMKAILAAMHTNHGWLKFMRCTLGLLNFILHMNAFVKHKMLEQFARSDEFDLIGVIGGAMKVHPEDHVIHKEGHDVLRCMMAARAEKKAGAAQHSTDHSRAALLLVEGLSGTNIHAQLAAAEGVAKCVAQDQCLGRSMIERGLIPALIAAQYGQESPENVAKFTTALVSLLSIPGALGELLKCGGTIAMCRALSAVSQLSSSLLTEQVFLFLQSVLRHSRGPPPKVCATVLRQHTSAGTSSAHADAEAALSSDALDSFANKDRNASAEQALPLETLRQLVPLLLAAMNRQQGHGKVQTIGCSIVAILSAMNPTTANLLFQNSVLPTLCGMDLHLPDVLDNCVEAILNLLNHEVETTCQARSASGEETVTDLVFLRDADQISTACISAMGHLHRSAQRRLLPFLDSCFGSIITALSRLPELPSLNSEGLSFLAALTDEQSKAAQENPGACRELASDLVGTVVGAMRNHPGNPSIQDAGGQALFAIVSNSNRFAAGKFPEFLDEGAVHALVQAVTQYPLIAGFSTKALVHISKLSGTLGLCKDRDPVLCSRWLHIISKVFDHEDCQGCWQDVDLAAITESVAVKFALSSQVRAVCRGVLNSLVRSDPRDEQNDIRDGVVAATNGIKSAATRAAARASEEAAATERRRLALHNAQERARHSRAAATAARAAAHVAWQAAAHCAALVDPIFASATATFQAIQMCKAANAAAAAAAQGAAHAALVAANRAWEGQAVLGRHQMKAVVVDGVAAARSASGAAAAASAAAASAQAAAVSAEAAAGKVARKVAARSAAAGAAAVAFVASSAAEAAAAEADAAALAAETEVAAREATRIAAEAAVRAAATAYAASAGVSALAAADSACKNAFVHYANLSAAHAIDTDGFAALQREFALAEDEFGILNISGSGSADFNEFAAWWQALEDRDDVQMETPPEVARIVSALLEALSAEGNGSHSAMLLKHYYREHMDLLQIFAHYDTDSNNYISIDEFKAALADLGAGFWEDDDELTHAFEIVNTSRTGRITLGEFKSWWLEAGGAADDVLFAGPDGSSSLQAADRPHAIGHRREEMPRVAPRTEEPALDAAPNARLNWSNSTSQTTVKSQSAGGKSAARKLQRQRRRIVAGSTKLHAPAVVDANSPFDVELQPALSPGPVELVFETWNGHAAHANAPLRELAGPDGRVLFRNVTLNTAGAFMLRACNDDGTINGTHDILVRAGVPHQLSFVQQLPRSLKAGLALFPMQLSVTLRDADGNLVVGRSTSCEVQITAHYAEHSDVLGCAFLNCGQARFPAGSLKLKRAGQCAVEVSCVQPSAVQSASTKIIVHHGDPARVVFASCPSGPPSVVKSVWRTRPVVHILDSCDNICTANEAILMLSLIRLKKKDRVIFDGLSAARVEAARQPEEILCTGRTMGGIADFGAFWKTPRAGNYQFAATARLTAADGTEYSMRTVSPKCAVVPCLGDQKRFGEQLLALAGGASEANQPERARQLIATARHIFLDGRVPAAITQLEGSSAAICEQQTSACVRLQHRALVQSFGFLDSDTRVQRANKPPEASDVTHASDAEARVKTVLGRLSNVSNAGNAGDHQTPLKNLPAGTRVYLHDEGGDTEISARLETGGFCHRLISRGEIVSVRMVLRLEESDMDTSDHFIVLCEKVRGAVHFAIIPTLRATPDHRAYGKHTLIVMLEASAFGETQFYHGEIAAWLIPPKELRPSRRYNMRDVASGEVETSSTVGFREIEKGTCFVFSSDDAVVLPDGTYRATVHSNADNTTIPHVWDVLVLGAQNKTWPTFKPGMLPEQVLLQPVLTRMDSVRLQLRWTLTADAMGEWSPAQDAHAFQLCVFTSKGEQLHDIRPGRWSSDGVRLDSSVPGSATITLHVRNDTKYFFAIRKSEKDAQFFSYNAAVYMFNFGNGAFDKLLAPQQESKGNWWYLCSLDGKSVSTMPRIGSFVRHNKLCSDTRMSAIVAMSAKTFGTRQTLAKVLSSTAKNAFTLWKGKKGGEIASVLPAWAREPSNEVIYYRICSSQGAVGYCVLPFEANTKVLHARTRRLILGRDWKEESVKSDLWVSYVWLGKTFRRKVATSGQVHAEKSLLSIAPELKSLLSMPSRARPVELELVVYR
jgi:hypothetical protein